MGTRPASPGMLPYDTDFYSLDGDMPNNWKAVSRKIR